MNLTTPQKEPYVYGAAKTAAVLGFGSLRQSQRVLLQVRDKGLIPYVHIGGAYGYDGLQVEYLAAKAQLAASHGCTGWDMALAELCHLLCKYESCPPGTSRWKLARYRAAVADQCRSLVADGQIVTLKTLTGELTDVVTPKAVKTWAERGRIATVKIGPLHYLTAKYCRALVELVAKHTKLVVAADALGCVHKTLQARIRKGELAVLHGPDGSVRISPSALKALQAARASSYSAGDTYTVKTAARLLGVPPSTVNGCIHEGKIAAVRLGRTLYIPRVEVERWQERRTTLNPGYEWLSDQITFSGRPTPTRTARQVYTDLKIGWSALTVWSQANLLPHYVRSFSSEGGRAGREYVALYVYGLVRFAGGDRVSKQQAREYQQLCTKAKAIV